MKVKKKSKNNRMDLVYQMNNNKLSTIKKCKNKYNKNWPDNYKI